MPYSIHVINQKEEVVLAYYFKGNKGSLDDIFEEKLRVETRFYWRKVSSPLSTVVSSRCILMHDCGIDCTILLSGDEDEDELGLQSSLTVLEKIISAVCEVDTSRLESRQILTFHGKVVVCLNEAYPLGVRRLTNADAVVKAAKLKAFS